MSSRTSSHSTLSPPALRTPALQHSISNQSARTSHSYNRPCCDQDECEHGLFSPHASPPPTPDSDDQTPAGNARGSHYTPTHLAYEPQHTESGNGGMFGGRHAGGTDLRHDILGDALADGIFGSGANNGKSGRGDGGEGEDGEPLSTTQWLARKHGVKGRRVMYVLFSQNLGF